MSQRGKRQSRLDNDEPPPTKKRKGRPPANKANSSNIGNGYSVHSNAAENGSQNASTMSPSTTSSAWQARSVSDIKISSIYNRSAPEPPAELFRKDLISAMKLPDSEPLASDEYWVITDQWKQERERGVQVPVSPDSLPEPTVLAKQQESFYTGRQDFKLPKNKFIRITKDENFSSDLHYLSNTPAMAKASCSYDLDPVDEAWLNILNGERTMAGSSAVTKEQFERVIKELEIVCWDKIEDIIKTEEGLGIEYDENVICDVCRSPDSEEANEMVFCNSCNICVHQACYGITTIPSGQWLCRTCSNAQKAKHADNHFNRMYLNDASTNKKSSKIYDSDLSSSSECHRRLPSSSEEDIVQSNSRQRNTSPNKNKSVSTKSLETKTIDKRKRRTTTAISMRKQKSFDSSSEDEDQSVRNRRRSKDSVSSTDSDANSRTSEKRSPKSRLLRQMERELEKLSGSESDELAPIRNSIGGTGRLNSDYSKKLSASIYSDRTDKEKTDNTASDSQNHTFRTKAPLKEFNSHHNSAAGKATSRNNKDNNSVTTTKAKEKERLEAEKERLQQDNYEQEQRARKDKAQKERQDKATKSKEKERLQREKQDKERQLKMEKERLAKIEQERIEKEAAEKERIERLQNQKTDKSKDKKKRKDVSKDFPTDLLVVPQRQAAKKASENMMRTQVVGASKKEQSKDVDKKEIPKELTKSRDLRDSLKDTTPTKEASIKQMGKPPKSKTKSPTQAEPTAASLELAKDKDVKPKKADKVDKDILVAYVPQRQAAKKAAEHIKGLGKVVASDVGNAAVPEEKLEKIEKPVTSAAITKSLQSNILTKSTIPSSPKLSSTSSSSSSSSPSSGSSGSSSSSSDSDDDSEAEKKDLPFLNKGSKSSSSASSDDSSSSDSDSSESSSDAEQNRNVARKASVLSNAKTKSAVAVNKRKDSVDKKASIIELPVSPKREEPLRSPTTKPARKSLSNDLRQSADNRSGNLA